MRNFVLCFSLIIVALAQVSCKEETLTPTLSVKPFSQGAIYPHNGDFTSSGSHGKTYLANPQSCTTCHGNELKGGSSKISCSSCHEAFPHTASFSSTASHGPFFLSNPQNCKTCHGSDYRGGSSKVSCRSCHKDFPHTVAFTTSKKHGLGYYKDPDSCKKCHGEKLDGGNNRYACSTCHSGFPHKEKFKTTAVHGENFFKDRDSCTQCHGGDYKGGNSKVSCKTCHSYPHASKWAVGKNHGQEFLKQLEPKKNTEESSTDELLVENNLSDENHSEDTKKISCKSCHARTSHMAANNPKQYLDCASCHKSVSLPHSEEFKLKEHGKVYLDDKNSCKTCHGADYAGGKVKKSCKECHNFPHPPNWANPKKHGAEFVRGVQEDRDSGGRGKDQQCLVCHKKKRRIPADVHARSGKRLACNTCHVDIPHEERITLPGKKKKHHGDMSSSDFFKSNCYSCHVKQEGADSNKRTNMPTYESCEGCHAEPKITFEAAEE
ncbi:MAG: hypothetical protein HOO06_12270 [Bdellovibrionaceae bacterium]|jgi:hypothetical protein|nr:hypothetical protein [Pseudobdellovibrionaceae bacterium]